MLRICEGKPNCEKKAEKNYRVTGWSVSFRERAKALCNTCPDELRSDRHQVEEIHPDLKEHPDA